MPFKQVKFYKECHALVESAYLISGLKKTKNKRRRKKQRDL